MELVFSEIVEVYNKHRDKEFDEEEDNDTKVDQEDDYDEFYNIIVGGHIENDLNWVYYLQYVMALD